jgi:ketosteroid isomerase-like protein
LAIRERLDDWVAATNRGDRAAARDVWAPAVVGWFPSAAVFSDSAAFAAAGLPFDRAAPSAISFTLRVDEVDVAGHMAAVHDVWVETRNLGGNRIVRREIRGSELWKCMPDGQWRIARYVSAPEPWTAVK